MHFTLPPPFTTIFEILQGWKEIWTLLTLLPAGPQHAINHAECAPYVDYVGRFHATILVRFIFGTVTACFLALMYIAWIMPVSNNEYLRKLTETTPERERS
jgi:hypothetical protein